MGGWKPVKHRRSNPRHRVFVLLAIVAMAALTAGWAAPASAKNKKDPLNFFYSKKCGDTDIVNMTIPHGAKHVDVVKPPRGARIGAPNVSPPLVTVIDIYKRRHHGKRVVTWKAKAKKNDLQCKNPGGNFDFPMTTVSFTTWFRYNPG